MQLLDRISQGASRRVRERVARLAFVAGACVGLVAAGMPASAQTWPDKPIRFIVSAPAGSSLDALARVIGDKLKDRLGQPVMSRTSRQREARSPSAKSPKRRPTDP